ncbi:MAG: hypothetical protein JSV09_11815 [Thermoplasmata archaeon]|nr:MAG: hypothetical protein JSV09_11815 [Thermoplasmata archaeon]
MANGITSEIDIGAIPTWVWLILLIVGLLLCFFGEIIWEFMVSILGAIIGSMIGFAIGFAIQGYLCALGLAIIFAIIGSMLFQLLAKAAVALLCGLLAFAATAYLVYTNNQDNQTAPIVIGLIVGVIIFVIAVIYVEEIVSVFLAAIGGFLVGVAVYFIAGGDSALILAGLAGGSMFILGAMTQLMYQRQRKRPVRAPQRRQPVRRARPARQPTKEQPPPAQEPKPTPKSPKPPKTNSGSQGGGY